nr:hypothetical protein [uncultured Roseateles sp.]
MHQTPINQPRQPSQLWALTREMLSGLLEALALLRARWNSSR